MSTRDAGPPRQIRTASGAVAKASQATTPMPVERMCPMKDERVQSSSRDSQTVEVRLPEWRREACQIIHHFR